jgi:hypothetical protein
MNRKPTTIQRNATYGHGLLRTRGGWTPREMLGADYEKFSGKQNSSFIQRSSVESTGKVLRQADAGAGSDKKK